MAEGEQPVMPESPVIDSPRNRPDRDDGHWRRLPAFDDNAFSEVCGLELNGGSLRRRAMRGGR
jgi:hypothetical protein